MVCSRQKMRFIMFFSCCRSKISFSQQQDAYIAYLAGEKGGQSPISKSDRKNALSAQPHPTGNKCAAITAAFLPAVAWTVFLGTAYLLTNRTVVDGIFGDSCAPCQANLGLLDNQKNGMMLDRTTELLGQAANSTVSMFNQLTNSTLSADFSSTPVNDSLPTNSSSIYEQCANGEILGKAGCSLANYAGSFIKTSNQAPFLLAAGFGLILAWNAMRRIESSQKGEKSVENNLINSLQNKFNEMADRLKTRAFCSGTEESEKAKGLALRIIHRQEAIQQEIVNLGIPSISSAKKANLITQNLFNAARAVADLETETQQEPQAPQLEEPVILNEEPQLSTKEIEMANPAPVIETADVIADDLVDIPVESSLPQEQAVS